MLASQAVEGEGSGQPTEPQHIPTTALPSHVEPIHNVASSSHPKNTHKHRKAKSKVTEIPQFSELTNLDADEAVYEERGDSVERAATTDGSLDAEQDSGNINRTQSTTIPNVLFPQEIGSGGSPRCQEAMRDTIAQTRSERVSTPSYDSPLLGVNTPGSDEERIELKKLMDMYTKLSDRVLDLENVKDAQALEIKKLKKRVKKLEKKKKSRTPQLKRRLFKVRIESSAEKSLGDQKDASKRLKRRISPKNAQQLKRKGRNSDKTEDLNVAENEHMFDLSDLAGTEVIADQEETTEFVEDKVTTASVNPEDSIVVDVSFGSHTRLVDDSTTDDFTLAETLMAIRSSASRPQKVKGVVFKEPSEPTTTLRPQPHIPAKDKGKGIMQEPEKPMKVKVGRYQIAHDADVAQRIQAELDEEARLEREREEEASNATLIEEWDSIEARIDADTQLAERLQAEEREQILVEEQARMLMELIATRKKFFAAKRAEEQRNKPPTKAEQRKKMCTYMKHIGGYKDKDFKDKSFDAIKQMFDKAYKQVNDFVPMDTESSEKKVDSSRKKAKSSNKRTRAVLGEESVKRQKVEDDAEKAELKACLEIVPSDDSAVNIESLATKYPIVFSAMLDDFDRQDVLDIYRLVKERFETTSLEGYDRLLWGDLITLFEPKKKYPLTQEMLSRMLSGRLEVDHECEMAFKLLRFTRSQLKK
ncbi:hypothetical protein Tco_0957280 [Tanacetum coccineum]